MKHFYTDKDIIKCVIIYFKSLYLNFYLIIYNNIITLRQLKLTPDKGLDDNKNRLGQL